ncbi:MULTISPECIES: TetR/AcrR family transcriptional regulator [Phenylobacterium]|uniref:AcrR family transcriptional regulator n=1 Tax=Phenylobacterium koreense TaxID=266125 RepID=A0ABV2EDK8_9CAUL
MARPKTFDRDDALDAAIGVFREHGFEGTSAQMLVGAMQIGRQSLYDTFGDKWRLYCEAVERYTQREALAHREALNHGPKAIDGLNAAIARVVEQAGQACLGVGSVCEFGRAHDDLSRLHQSADRALSSAFAEQIARAQAQGNVAASIVPEEAAGFLLANIAGIRIAARAGAGRDQLRALGELAIRALR